MNYYLQKKKLETNKLQVKRKENDHYLCTKMFSH